MQFDPSRCPQCGNPPKGTVERLFGLALLVIDEATGTTEYLGDTEVWWNSQETVHDERGQVTLVCPHDHEWKARMTE